MELSDLKIFRAVVLEGGVTRAAAQLNRVQSSVTTRIQQLEADLDVALFFREGKRLRLSPAGRVLDAYAERLLALAAEAREAVVGGAPRGPFRLGAMESTAAVRLPEPLTRFLAACPDIDLQLRTGNPAQLSALLFEGGLDAAFVAEPVRGEVFDSVPVFDEPLTLITATKSPPLAPGDPPPETAVAFEPGCPHRALLEHWYASCGAAPRQLLELGSYHAMLGCVAAGMGVALVPKSVLAGFPSRAHLREHAPPIGLDRAMTHLIWRRGARSAAIDALRGVLSEAAAP